MIQGTAEVVSFGTDFVEFKVTCGTITDDLTVWFSGHMTGRQNILGLEHLFGVQAGDKFSVDLKAIPPKTSTKTHLDVKAFTEKLQKNQYLW